MPEVIPAFIFPYKYAISNDKECIFFCCIYCAFNFVFEYSNISKQINYRTTPIVHNFWINNIKNWKNKDVDIY